MKVYRGAPAGARNYLEAGRCRADDYYLIEGSGVARRYAAGVEHPVRELTGLDGEGYEAWVAGLDPATGEPRGRLRQDANAVRFVEVVVNGPKSWSLAAELHPEIAAAYEAAQDRAGEEIIGWLARRVTTRVGPRGQQVAVPVEYLEAAVVRHYTSRAGDPHRHLHVQINARVFAAGKWRGLDTVTVRDSLAAVNGIGHTAIACDPQFRAALARHGYTLNSDGELAQLAPCVGAFSKRAAQIGRHLDRYEAAWRTEHPGQEPGPALRRGWDTRAWATQRPDKVSPVSGAKLRRRWLDELAALGYRDRDTPVPVTGVPVAGVDRDQVVEVVLAELGAARSGWNAADVRGAVEQQLAALGLLAEPAARAELAEDLTARAVARCVPLLDRPGTPGHIRAMTSEHVLDVETDLVGRLAARAAEPHPDPAQPAVTAEGLDVGQAAAVAALAGDQALVVIEGAAGAGKTTTLAAARDQLTARGRAMVVVTPTLRAARVVEGETGAAASSAAKLAHAHGWRWDTHGTWTRLHPGQTDPVTGATYTGPAEDLRLHAGDVLLVDEAGMLDQDTARALLTLADEAQARVAFVGDRHQLPAVGRGGVLDHAARWTQPITLDVAHRFVTITTTPAGRELTVPDRAYAELAAAMRTGEDPDAVYTVLNRRGQLAVHPDPATLHEAVAAAVVADRRAGQSSCVVAAIRERAGEANQAIRDAMINAGLVDDTHAVTTRAGERLGAGDLVATRRNDRDLAVANRDTWTVTATRPDGALHVRGPAGQRLLPADYVTTHVELAYATTGHGAQGLTVDHAHLLLDEHTTAAGGYVGLTRGRRTNTAHLIATTDAEAREQWTFAFGRDRADLGPAHTRDSAAREAARYAPPRPLQTVLAELHEAWLAREQARERLARLRPALRNAEDAAGRLADLQPALRDARARLDTARAAYDDARRRLAATDHAIAAEKNQHAALLHAAWQHERPAADAAARRIRAGTGRFGRGRRDLTAAQQRLDAWAERWQPVLDRLPAPLADPAALATGWHSAAVAEAVHAHAADTANAGHPEQAVQQDAAAQAEAAYSQARREHTPLAEQQYVLNLARPERAGEFRDLIPRVERQLTTADGTITRLLGEPALSTQPNPTALLTAATRLWQHERQIRRGIDRTLGDGKEPTTRRPPMPAPSYTPQPNPGPSIGR